MIYLYLNALSGYLMFLDFDRNSLHIFCPEQPTVPYYYHHRKIYIPTCNQIIPYCSKHYNKATKMPRAFKFTRPSKMATNNSMKTYVETIIIEANVIYFYTDEEFDK